MAVLVTGAAGFIGAATSRALLERGDEVVGIDNLNDYYDPRSSGAARRSSQRNSATASGSSGSTSPMPRRSTRVDRRAWTSKRSSISARRPAFATASRTPRLYSVEPRRPCNMLELARNAAAAAHGLCVVIVGLWRQQDPALPGRGPRRSPAFALRRDQEGRRALERKLCQSLSPAADRPSFLHRLRTVGPARHGDVDLHQGALRRRAAAACSTAARCAATSPTSTTSSAASIACLDSPPADDGRGESGRKHQPARALQYRQQPQRGSDAGGRAARAGDRQEGAARSPSRCRSAT